MKNLSMLKELELEIKEMEIKLREAVEDYHQKDVIAVATRVDAEEAYAHKEDLTWELVRMNDSLKKLKREWTTNDVV